MFTTKSAVNGKLKELKKEISTMNSEYDIQIEKVETDLQLATNDK